MPLTGIKDIVDAELEGRTRTYRYRKTPSQSGSVGVWFDLSMSPGMPVPKYWFDATPLTSKAIYQSEDGGAFHGANVSPSEKYLKKITVQGYCTSTTSPAPINMILCDYLLYYPTIDDGTTTEQVMANTVSLPRYADGDGVQMIAVTTGARTGNQDFTISYTNQDGVAGRTTPTLRQNTSTALGSLTTTSTATLNSASPFIALQSGDRGVRSIQSVTMSNPDVGLFSLILVKPLSQICMREIVASTTVTAGTSFEKEIFVTDNMIPRIYDNAFLNFIILPLSSTIASTYFIADLNIIWK